MTKHRFAEFHCALGAGAQPVRNLTPIMTANGMKAILSVSLLMLMALAGCDSGTPTKTPEAKPAPKGPELLTGRAAFQKTYIAARGWARDAQPFRIQSQSTSDGTGQDGKWAVWRASFASPSGHSAKPFIWSGSDSPDAPSRGVSPGTEDSYNPSNSSTQIFDVAFLKVDSDQAVAVAQKHGGDKIVEKDPKTIINYVCEWNHNTNELVWHIMYGANRESAKLTISVNASSGEFIRVEK